MSSSEPTAVIAKPPKAAKKKKRPLQYYTILLHRYLGYFFLGITLVYAISGLAVNHMEDWNANFIMDRQSGQIQPLIDAENLNAEEARVLYKQFKVDSAFNPDNVFYPDDVMVEVLVSANEKIMINTETWQAQHEIVRRRPGLHLFNFIHLNNAKKAWTFYADLYAIGLLLLALTGLFMKKGKKGVFGEAGIWTVAGMILPVILILMYYR